MNDIKKFLLVFMTVAITAYFAARSIPLIPRGDFDAAIVFALGIPLLTIPLVFFARLQEHESNRRFRCILAALPSVTFLGIIAAIVLS